MQTDERETAEGVAASRPYKWGSFQGWASVAIGLSIFLPAPFVSVALPIRLAMYATGVINIFMGLCLVGRKRLGFILLCALSLLVTVALMTSHPHVEMYFIVIGWYIIPAVFYYPKRWRWMR